MWGKFRLVAVRFFFTLIELAKELPLWRKDRSTPSELPTDRLELPGTISSETEQQPDNNDHDRRIQIDNVMNMQWALLVIGACFAAIGVVLQALQIRATLPAAASFPWLCVAFEMAFLAMLVSAYIRRHYPRSSCVMEHVAVFFCAVALLLAIRMTLDPPLKQMSVALFFIGFTIIILANCSLRDWV
ncbi:uncharacterized protein [Coffea arabica]|uniref:Uncharacterized protein n=1 Tax=Coffea arabica TaxID=13443 RepID=A0ABM4VQ15_COFAR